MSLRPRALRRVLAAPVLVPRPAREADLAEIAALVAPHVAAGTLLPPVLAARHFVVVEEQGLLLGCVALKAWSGRVVELGSLVAGTPGRGLGRILVEAACARAVAGGFATVVALTGTPAFFLRCGFELQPDSPAAVAREGRTSAALGGALQGKARTCARCPRLARCGQALLSRRLP